MGLEVNENFNKNELKWIGSELKLNWKVIENELKPNSKLSTKSLQIMNELHVIGICDIYYNTCTKLTLIKIFMSFF